MRSTFPILFRTKNLPVPNPAEVATSLPFKLYAWPHPRPAPLPSCARLNASCWGRSGTPRPWFPLIGGACCTGGAGSAGISFLFFLRGQSSNM